MAIVGENVAFVRQIKDLFPTRLTALIFIAYMILFINQGLLITSTKSNDNQYRYDPTIVVLLTEYLKLFGSIAIYLRSDSLVRLIHECNFHKNVLLKYFIPAFLYCLYNNLQFTNLAQYDPATYFILLQFRVVVTGVIYQILFARKLTSTQWLSLLILTLGCVVKQTKPEPGSSLSLFGSVGLLLGSIQLDYHLLLILVQILCSCFAGVYNEFLLKNKSSATIQTQTQTSSHTKNGSPRERQTGAADADDDLLLITTTESGPNTGTALEHKSLPHQQSKDVVPIMVQNVFMYLASIVCNYLYLYLLPNTHLAHPSHQPVSSPLTNDTLTTSAIYSDPGIIDQSGSFFSYVLFSDWRIAAIVLNGAAIGLVTSFFLKYLDSILKNFASALEIIFTAILAKFIFGIAIGTNTILATVLVCYAVYLYSRNPVRRV